MLCALCLKKEARIAGLARAKAQLPAEGLKAWAAIVGGLVADAAAVPCHWQYDKEKLTAMVGADDPAFYGGRPQPNPFYEVAVGSNSCYGDQVAVLVSCMARSSPDVDAADVAARFYERFTAEDYASSVEAKRQYAYAGDQRDKLKPINGPWRHGTIDLFVQAYGSLGTAYEADTSDASVDAVLRALPVAAAAGLAGVDPEPSIEAAVAVTQANDLAVRHAKAIGRALAEVVVGRATAKDALAAVLDVDRLDALRAARDLTAEPTDFPAAVEALRGRLPQYAQAHPHKIIA